MCGKAITKTGNSELVEFVTKWDKKRSAFIYRELKIILWLDLHFSALKIFNLARFP